ncbi:MAG: P63C domain-containing protein [Aestuariivirga sp.]|uniref:P63C domain-containing protein n=1 Tax=Aestuariivirga sp. TaxID=2650926 RepID=UPI0038D06663
MNDEITGKAKGGKARANALTPIERKAIAQKAAIARWDKPYSVTHKGSLEKDFGIAVDCYVLNDTQKTPVISKRGMGEAIGFSRRGERLVSFVNSKAMSKHIGRELREKIENPIVFQPKTSAATNAISERAHGYDATILIDLCQAIIQAKNAGKLQGPRYEKMLQQAEILLSASAKNGIRGLVYAVAGYNPSAQEVIDAFKVYVREEAKKYEPEFPNELYIQWHRLYDIAVPERGKPWHFKHLTVKHVYYPLAQSNGKLLTLLRALRANEGDRARKLFQFLNDVGARALRMQLGRVLEMAESSPDKKTYEGKIIDRFGGQKELDLVIPSPNASAPPSEPAPAVRQE